MLLFPWLSKHLNFLLSRSGKYSPNINKQFTQKCLFLQIKVWSEIKFCNFRIKGTSTTTFLINVLPIHGGQDSSISIATSYGLDGPGIKSQWGWDFSHLSRPALGPTQPPVQCIPGLSRG
jgi:hypothetical protein